jgi:uncharacterized protein YwgA
VLDRKLYILVKKALGEEFITEYPNDFNTRLIVQKMLYLISHGMANPKVDLPYNWSFYLRGPYSSEIAHAIYHINETIHELASEDIPIIPEEDRAIHHFVSFKDELKTMEKQYKIPLMHFFETVASLVYFCKGRNLDKTMILDKFKRLKPELFKELGEPILKELMDQLNQYCYC